MRRRVVLSGCSGGGKSSLLEELARRGHATCAEAGRDIVTAEEARGGTVLPWLDLPAFVRATLELSVERFDAAAPGVTFYDRSFLDAQVWFLSHGGLPGDCAERIGDRRYDGTVYLVPPWRDIYRIDDARRHGWDAAVAEFEALHRLLPDLGYRTVEVPRLTIGARAEWIERQVAGTA
ncbi:AAA family ATPase [Pseudooceanicola sp. 216_PA32_1]|uniref:AAA family ATPase n=1 Tax=Pseudooceanicola pacificus TaxID=2676438 RepID=A0A844WBR0_9RHOB|nr:AAA family ATPase [Pseudooceanicola pacificus]MWB78643.1 AAA family ATPase [Pseudooceanicola pacificus]